MNNLTREQFEKFLTALDSDRTQAAKKYEILRRKLLKLFERRQCIQTEELADETLDRLAKRLAAEPIQDVSLFACGIARKIYFEARRKTGRLISIEECYGHEDLMAGGDTEQNITTVLANAQDLGCLTKCLAALPLECHELILEYYRGEKRVRIEQRKALARKRGISMEALRSEASRVRDRLRNCVTRCLSQRQQAIHPELARRVEVAELEPARSHPSLGRPQPCCGGVGRVGAGS